MFNPGGTVGAAVAVAGIGVSVESEMGAAVGVLGAAAQADKVSISKHRDKNRFINSPVIL
jgi:hypothetical protein